MYTDWVKSRSIFWRRIFWTWLLADNCTLISIIINPILVWTAWIPHRDRSSGSSDTSNQHCSPRNPLLPSTPAFPEVAKRPCDDWVRWLAWWSSSPCDTWPHQSENKYWLSACSIAGKPCLFYQTLPDFSASKTCSWSQQWFHSSSLWQQTCQPCLQFLLRAAHWLLEGSWLGRSWQSEGEFWTLIWYSWLAPEPALLSPASGCEG